MNQEPSSMTLWNTSKLRSFSRTRSLRLMRAFLLVISSLIVVSQLAITPAVAVPVDPIGYGWATRTTPNSNNWRDVAYGCPTPQTCQFVAVAADGTNRVMTSPDGIVWTARTASAARPWWSVTFGGGRFVVVANDTTVANNIVMSSTNGINWTSHSSPVSDWREVEYGCPTTETCQFVAVAADSAVTQVMTSTDGQVWTPRTTAAFSKWHGLTFGNGKFVAVSNNGGSNQVMTSTNGVDWVLQSTPLVATWRAVAYGNGLFAAVAISDAGINAVMTSTDGITWNTRPAASQNRWIGITYGNGMFVAVSENGESNRIMTSQDGITWVSRSTAGADNAWKQITYGCPQPDRCLFVATGNSGTLNRIMTSNDLFVTQDGDNLVLVPKSGTTPDQYRIHYNTVARVASSKAWGQWGFNWANTSLSATGNTININLSTYQNAGSCSAAPLNMPATDCPRPAAIGIHTSGTTMQYRVLARDSTTGTWLTSPAQSITRPS